MLAGSSLPLSARIPGRNSPQVRALLLHCTGCDACARFFLSTLVDYDEGPCEQGRNLFPVLNDDPPLNKPGYREWTRGTRRESGARP